jgi:hypothetical protein
MLQRFHETIDRAARAEAMSSTQARSPRPVATFLFGAAAAAAVLVAVFAGLRVGSDIPSETVPMVVDVTPPIESNPASLKRSLQVYFRSGQQQLGDWPAASDSDRTSMIIALVGQNRRYEKLATQHEAADLARVLRAFEPIPRPARPPTRTAPRTPPAGRRAARPPRWRPRWSTWRSAPRPRAR